MVRCRALAGLALLCAGASFSRCGGSTPAQPAPAPTVATPTPAPTPTPLALSVIPPCPLPPSNPGAGASCTKPRARFGNDLDAAIDRVIRERPDLFNPNDVDGGPRILNYDAYMTAVVAAINQGGLCGHIDPEGEIGVKADNSYNEQYIIASKAGYNPPVGNWVQRKYVGACVPAVF
jgi:hypothetical protein